MKRYSLLSAAAVILACALGIPRTRSVVHAAAVMAPRFEVDPYWPKPLPNHWILGQTIGVSADSAGPYLDHSSRRLAWIEPISHRFPINRRLGINSSRGTFR
jgi:hypothetical protein